MRRKFNGNQCTAKSKTTGERCAQPAAHGFSVCVYHGGKTPAGIASATFKHGLYSKQLPTRLAARYREATENPELVALKHDAAVAVTRICELLSELDEEGSPALWRAARAKLAEFKASINDVERARAVLNELDDIFARGAGTEARWERIGKWIDTHGRLVEKEWHRLKDLQLVMTAEQAALVFTALQESVLKHVKDNDALVAISEDLRRLSAREGW